LRLRVFRDAIEPVRRLRVCRGLLLQYGIIWELVTGNGWRKWPNTLFVEDFSEGYITSIFRVEK
jgi:hypothetical protein